MTKNVLYVYEGSNGVIWSPVLLPMEHTTMSRLVADTGKVITDGTQYYSILDVADSDISKYTEIELTDDIQKAMEG